jgi:starvation-inducible outer membrane lipoprotein
MDHSKKIRLLTGLLIISLTLLLSSCVLPHPALDTTYCNPQVRDDCYSVSTEDLLIWLDKLAAKKETDRALKSCQSRL